MTHLGSVLGIIACRMNETQETEPPAGAEPGRPSAKKLRFPFLRKLGLLGDLLLIGLTLASLPPEKRRDKDKTP
jgi:hypothetical protein